MGTEAICVRAAFSGLERFTCVGGGATTTTVSLSLQQPQQTQSTVKALRTTYTCLQSICMYNYNKQYLILLFSILLNMMSLDFTQCSSLATYSWFLHVLFGVLILMYILLLSSSFCLEAPRTFFAIVLHDITC